MTLAETEDGYLIDIPDTFHGYKFIKVIGAGSTSVVCLVEDERIKKYFSAKIIPKEYIKKKNLFEQIKNEISIHSQINHPNIVKFNDYFEIKEDGKESYIVIIMEYCENGDLYSLISDKGFQNDLQKYKIIKQFMEAVKYLHSNGIAHGDIKPENILLDSDFNAKLSDFGFSKTDKIAGEDSKSGSLYYAPPEMFFRGFFDTFKADIWSIGITLYCLTENSFPYDFGNENFIIDQITSQMIYLNENMPENIRKVVEKCTEFDPKKRPNIDELINYEYFVEGEKLADSLKNDDFGEIYPLDDDDIYSIFY